MGHGTSIMAPPFGRMGAMVRGTLAGGALGAFAGCAFGGFDPRRTHTYAALADCAAVPLMRRFLDPEKAHEVSVRATSVGLAPRDPGPPIDALRTRVFGRNFDSPVGLAAGYDKHGEALEGLLNMGFSFVEVGGVTPLPQDGNPRPRLFRLVADRGVINRFGLNSHGADVVAGRLSKFKASSTTRGLVGVNLAKNTGNDDAEGDYRTGVRKLGPHVDFIVVNVSCPNVSWSSAMSSTAISDLVHAVRKERDDACPGVPVLLKIGPDGPKKRRALAKLALDAGVDGLIVSNTSSSRPDTLKSEHRAEAGGLSGAPIKAMALETLKDARAVTKGKIPIIGVGGIESGADAYERIRAGASLVQIYSALVFQGPGLVGRIKRELAACLQRDGFDAVEDAVGVDVDVSSYANK